MYIFVTPNGNLEECFLWIVYNSFTILPSPMAECSDDTCQGRRTQFAPTKCLHFFVGAICDRPLGGGFQHILDKNSISPRRIVYKDVCVLMIPTKPLNFRKPRIQVNYDFAIGSLIVINLFKNDL